VTMSDDCPPMLPLGDGALMPQLGLGLWRTPPQDAAEVVRTAIYAGYRLIDTAAIYGNESGVGEGLRAAGPEAGPIFITTKLWNDQQGYDRTLRAFDKSLRRLGLGAVALYLIHWPAPMRGLYVESWRALIRLKREGRARSIGVSNFDSEHLLRIIGETGVVPAVNQVELHPRFQQRNLRALHARHGIRSQSWSPLGQGGLLSDQTIIEIAARHDKTPAQVIIRWHLENGLIVIPKSANAGRILENINVFDFCLHPLDHSQIANMDRTDGRIGAHHSTAGF
jgi:2,5-diketo-D-gluconate reductase A